MRTILVELCAGTSAVSLFALGRLSPLTGYMGSKRRDAAVIVRALGLREPPAEVHLVDAGPWGDVWASLKSSGVRARVVEILMRWDGLGTLPEVWPSLQYPPPADPAERVAQYLCLQSRSAGCIPVWWAAERERWESPSGSRTEGAHRRGGCDLATRMGRDAAPMPCARKVGKVYRSHPGRGVVRISTLARRVEALDGLDWTRIVVHHCDIGQVQPIPGAVVYFDPPYNNAPRYAALLPRRSVLEVAERWASVADLVVISEAEPLPLAGWSSVPLRDGGKPEWLTSSRPVRVEIHRQLPLTQSAECAMIGP